MENLFRNDNDGPLESFTNPFTQDNWQNGGITFYKNWDGKIKWSGILSFHKGSASGQQSFEANSFKELLIQMQKFLDALK